MYLLSRVQKYPGIGRFVSVVSRRAALNGSSTPLTYILRVFFHGLRKEMNFPSGEIWAPAISGSPKNKSRSIMGGKPACFSCAWDLSRTGNRNKTQQNAKAERLVMVDSFIVRGERQHCTPDNTQSYTEMFPQLVFVEKP